ncbi:C-C motif chemokine 13-like [Athene noctua]|uniref:C-C motif chemokine 13-like n=1 Tax=Athene noctua TaxID=126797 RepID=UPI003EB7281C
MKVSTLALLTMLLAALWTESQSASFRSLYGACCYKKMFLRNKIPDNLIKSYQETPSHCSHRAVRVETLKGQKFCVDPKKKWFQDYLQRKEANDTST